MLGDLYKRGRRQVRECIHQRKPVISQAWKKATDGVEPIPTKDKAKARDGGTPSLPNSTTQGEQGK